MRGERPRVHRGTVTREGHREGHRDRRRRSRGVRRARLARRCRTEPRFGGHLRPGELLVPARHASVRGGGRHRNRAGADSLLRMRRRRRARDQPVDRGGTGSRWACPGHRTGPVRGGRARRSGTLLSASFAEYLVPSAVDLPSFTTGRTESPATGNPLGVKGVGEAGTIASTPAVVNAVLDAVRHLGVRDIEMPCSPMRVWQAIHSGPREMPDDSTEVRIRGPHHRR